VVPCNEVAITVGQERGGLERSELQLGRFAFRARARVEDAHRVPVEVNEFVPAGQRERAVPEATGEPPNRQAGFRVE
jgi:hypothetical protein